MLEDLKARRAEVESLLKSGTLGGIYVPALQAKDLALEIQAAHPEANRDVIEASVKQIVLAAYQLDNYGDMGDAAKAQDAFRTLSTAIAAARFARAGATLMERGAAALAVVVVLMIVPAGDAHEGITSKFTYNADVYPVFLNRCGRCHIDGGVGPMSLLKYEDAFPWAESLRAELLAATTGDPHDFVKAAHRQISARELDIVLNWATGGTPEGDKAQTPPPASLHIEWAAGQPDVIATDARPLSHERHRAGGDARVGIADPCDIGRNGRPSRSPARQSRHRPQRGAVAAVAGRYGRGCSARGCLGRCPLRST